MPAILGLQATGVFAVGIALAVAVAAAVRFSLPAAAAAGVLAAVVSLALWGGSLGALRPGLHETAWSVALCEWVAAAGMLGALLRRPFPGAALSGWLVAAIAWGAHRGYPDEAFWRSLAVAGPAIGVVLSSLGLLVPRTLWARRPAAAARAPR